MPRSSRCLPPNWRWHTGTRINDVRLPPRTSNARHLLWIVPRHTILAVSRPGVPCTLNQNDCLRAACRIRTMMPCTLSQSDCSRAACRIRTMMLCTLSRSECSARAAVDLVHPASRGMLELKVPIHEWAVRGRCAQRTGSQTGRLITIEVDISDGWWTKIMDDLHPHYGPPTCSRTNPQSEVRRRPPP